MLENKLKEIRTNRNMTEQELADKVLISKQTVNSIENGRYIPSIALAFKLANTLDVTLTKLFNYKDY